MNDVHHPARPCIACGQETSTEYCSHCGEYQQHKRFTFRKVITDIPNAIMNFERGLPYTIRKLALQPGAAIREYLAGARSRHYRPLNFVFLTGGLYTLLFSLVRIQGLAEENANRTASEEFMFEQLLQYQAFLLLLQLPFMSMVSWLLFRGKKYFYGEHLVGNAYMVGEITWYQIICFPLYALFNHSAGVDVLNMLYVLFIAGFGFFTYYDWFYQRRGGAGAVILTIVAVLANITLVVLTAEPLMLLIYQIRTAIFGE